MSRSRVPEERRPCVYRVFGFGGVLLYVGQTTQRRTRMDYHGSRAAWRDEVYRVEYEDHPTVESATRAEAIAICHEDPIYNKRDWFEHEGWETCTGTRHVEFWTATLIEPGRPDARLQTQTMWHPGFRSA